MSKIVMISGTSSGIGYALAELYLRKGYIVYGISRRPIFPDGMIHIQVDLSQHDDCLSKLAKFFESHEAPDILILNAGFGVSGPIEKCDFKQSLEQFKINYFGSLTILQVLLEKIRLKFSQRNESALIIFVSSLASYIPLPFQAHYAASKSAITSLSRSLNIELYGQNIKVTSIHPGDIATEFTQNRSKLYSSDDEIYKNCSKSIMRMERDECEGKSAEWLAEHISKIENKHFIKPIYIPGFKYKLVYYIQKFLPIHFTDYIVRKIYN